MDNPKTEASERVRLLAKAVSQWDNGGGACEGGHVPPASGASLADALPLTNAEITHLQVRVIALENLMKVLFADAPEHQMELMRDVAALISPHPSCTQHPLTIQATACMISLVGSAGHLRERRLGSTKIDASSP